MLEFQNTAIMEHLKILKNYISEWCFRYRAAVVETDTHAAGTWINETLQDKDIKILKTDRL